MFGGLSLLRNGGRGGNSIDGVVEFISMLRVGGYLLEFIKSVINSAHMFAGWMKKLGE